MLILWIPWIIQANKNQEPKEKKEVISPITFKDRENVDLDKYKIQSRKHEITPEKYSRFLHPRRMFRDKKVVLV